MIRTLFLLLFTLGTAAQTQAAVDEPELCAPFQDGQVDSRILTHMLEAADEGYLYRIQEEKSRVGFCIESAIGRIEGRFNRFRGGFTMNAKPDEHALLLIETGSVSARGVLVDNMIRGEMFLDSDNYPEMLFVSTGFYWINQNEAVLIGDLTIRGITKKVGLHVELSREQEEIGDYGQYVKVRASTRIRRSEYGIISLSPMLSDEIDLCMTVEAVRIAS